MGDDSTTEVPLWPTSTPVAMLASGPLGMRGWSVGSAQVQAAPVSPHDRAIYPGTDFLAPGGQAVVTAVTHRNDVADGTGRSQERFDGILRTRLTSGHHDHANFSPQGDPKRLNLFFGGSPGATRVAVLEHWNSATEAMPDTSGLPAAEASAVRAEYYTYFGSCERRTITVASFDGSPAREILATDHPPKSEYGLSFALDSVHSLVQWSPDGSLLAVWLPLDNNGTAVPAIRILDTRTWQQVAEFPRAFLAGSASWGQANDRLLLEAKDTQTHRRYVWIQHLNGDQERVTAIPAPNRAGVSAVRPLGLTDNGRLITVRAARGKATLALTSAQTGEHRDVISWPDDKETRPVIAQMPADAWM